LKTTDDNIGKAFKEAFDDFEIKPSNSVWQSVNSKNVELGNVNHSSLFSKIAIISAAAIIALATIYYLYKPSVNPSPNIIKEIPINSIDSVVTVQMTNEIDVSLIDSTKDEKVEIVNNSTDNKQDNSKKYKAPIIVKDTEDNIEKTEVAIVEEKKEIKNIINPPSPSIELSNDKIVQDEEEHKQSILTNTDTFKVVYGDNPVVCFGEDAILFVEDGFNYSWNTGDVQNRITVSPVQKSHYTVTVTNSKGQESIHVFTVDVDNSCSALFIPSAFTPNFDGQNDVFKAEGRGITQMHMMVYNKLGQKVFESTNIDIGWDGSFKGKLSPETYVYHVDYTDAKGIGHVKRGQVTLIK